MALTRKMLAAMGIEPEKIDQIIEAHSETVEGLKSDRDRYKADADKLPDIQKQLEELKEESTSGDKSYKELYEQEHQNFEQFKKDQGEKETKARKVEAYRNLLKEAGISDKHLNAVLKVSDVDSIEFDDDGKVKDSQGKVDAIKTEWADFITTTRTEGAKTSTPPENNGGSGLSADAAYARARFAKQYAAKYGKDPNEAENKSNGGNE